MSDWTLRVWQEHPHVGRHELPRIKRTWLGRKVAVRYIARRGDYYRHTHIRWAWGELVPAERDEHVAVRTRDGVKNIHYTRVTEVFDLTRRKS